MVGNTNGPKVKESLRPKHTRRTPKSSSGGALRRPSSSMFIAAGQTQKHLKHMLSTLLHTENSKAHCFGRLHSPAQYSPASICALLRRSLNPLGPKSGGCSMTSFPSHPSSQVPRPGLRLRLPSIRSHPAAPCTTPASPSTSPRPWRPAPGGSSFLGPEDHAARRDRDWARARKNRERTRVLKEKRHCTTPEMDQM